MNPLYIFFPSSRNFSAVKLVKSNKLQAVAFNSSFFCSFNEFFNYTSVSFCFDFFSKTSFGSFFASFSRFLGGLNQYYYSRLLLKGIGFKGIFDPVSRYYHMELGYNNICSVKIPPQVLVKTRKNRIVLYSFNISILNSLISVIRNSRVPDPYRGKGVRFHNQFIKFKIGKQR